MYQAWNDHQGEQKTTPSQDSEELPRSAERQYPGNSMLELVTARMSLGVSDPRGMIFAHMGFASDGQDPRLEVDYPKECKQVYINFALFIKDRVGWGTLLEIVENSKSYKRLKELPWWVPDWTVPFPARTKFPRRQEFCTIYEGALGIYTKEFDTINVVSSELSIDQIPSDFRQELTSRLLRLRLSLTDGFVHVENKDDTRSLFTEWTEVYRAWEMAIKDLPRFIQPNISLINLDISTAEHLKFMEPRGNETDIAKVYKSYESSRTIKCSVEIFLILAFRTDLKLDYLAGKALTLTRSCHLALVPSSSRTGDLITPLPYRNVRGHLTSASKSFIFRRLQRPNNENVKTQRITTECKTNSTVRIGRSYTETGAV